MARENHPITAEEASHAIYLDFEGVGKSRKSDPDPLPVLGGTIVDGDYFCHILDERLRQGADAKSFPLLSLTDYLASLIDRAKQERRRIVYWTSHEEAVFRSHGFPPDELGFDLKIEVKPHFRRLFKESKEAYGKLFEARGAKKDKLRQKAFGLCVQCAEQCSDSFRVPSAYGKGMVGGFIRMALDECEAKDSYSKWKPSAKRRWSRLISHNRLDCEAMVLLMNRYGHVEPA